MKSRVAKCRAFRAVDADLAHAASPPDMKAARQSAVNHFLLFHRCGSPTAGDRRQIYPLPCALLLCSHFPPQNSRACWMSSLCGVILCCRALCVERGLVLIHHSPRLLSSLHLLIPSPILLPPLPSWLLLSSSTPSLLSHLSPLPSSSSFFPVCPHPFFPFISSSVYLSVDYLWSEGEHVCLCV